MNINTYRLSDVYSRFTTTASPKIDWMREKPHSFSITVQLRRRNPLGLRRFQQLQQQQRHLSSTIHLWISEDSWLVVEPTPFEKYARQNGNLPQVGAKIKNIWNHHPDSVSMAQRPIWRRKNHRFHAMMDNWDPKLDDWKSNWLANGKFGG